MLPWLVAFALASSTSCSCVGLHAFDPAAASRVVACGDHVAWLESPAAQDRLVWRRVDGSDGAVILWSGGAVDALASDGEELVFAVQSPDPDPHAELFVQACDGGAARSLGRLTERASQVAIAEGTVVVREGDALLTVSLATGAQAEIATTTGEVLGVVATPTRAVWLTAAGEQSLVCAVALAGGASTCAAPGPRDPNARIVAVGETLWWTRGFEADARIERLALGASAPEIVARPGATLGALAIDAERVYWVESVEGRWQRLVRLEGDETTVVASHPFGHGSIALGDGVVFWPTDEGVMVLPR